METTITFGHLWRIFKHAWWKIAIIVLLVAVAAGAATHYLVPRSYASTTEFYIVNVNQNIDYITSSTVAADQLLAENYIEVIKSDAMMSKIAEKLKVNHEIDMTNKEIRSLISASTNNNASIFSVTVTAKHPTLAYKIACYITEFAPDLVTEITKPSEMSATVSLQDVAANLADKADKDNASREKYGEVALAVQNAADKLKENEDSLTVKGTLSRLECIQVIREPVENPSHVSPSITKACAIAALGAAVLAYLFFFLRDFLNTMIRTEEDIKRVTDLPILGSIPSWETDPRRTAGAAYGYGSKGGAKK